MTVSVQIARQIESHFSDAVLRALVIERRLKVAHGLLADFPPLVTRDELETTIGQHEKGSRWLRVFVGRREMDLAAMRVVADGQLNFAVLRQLIAQGATLVFRHLERCITAVEDLGRPLSERLGIPVEINAVLSFGDRSGLRPHHDPENLIIIQVDGTKHWRFLGEPVEPGLPHAKVNEELSVTYEVTLNPGDVMFLPAGLRHVCTASPEDSLHLAVLMMATNAAEVAPALTEAIANDVPLRTPYLPFLGAEAIEAATAAYRERLHALVDAMDLEALLAEKSRPQLCGDHQSKDSNEVS
jgi:hypothetical protein